MAKRAKHTGEYAINCPVCITTAERDRMPWVPGYFEVIANNPLFQKRHDAAMRRNERNQTMRDLGMVKTPYGWE